MSSMYLERICRVELKPNNPQFSAPIEHCARLDFRGICVRADLICNNPSRMAIQNRNAWEFYERSDVHDAVCTSVFGIDFFARIFGPMRA